MLPWLIMQTSGETTVSASVSLPWESLGYSEVSSSISIPWEGAGILTSSITPAFEGLAIVTSGPEIPWESTAALDLTVFSAKALNWESLASRSVDYEIEALVWRDFTITVEVS